MLARIKPVLSRNIQLYAEAREYLMSVKYQGAKNEEEKETISKDESWIGPEADIWKPGVIEDSLREQIRNGHYLQAIAFLDLGIEYLEEDIKIWEERITAEETVQESHKDIPSDDLDDKERWMRAALLRWKKSVVEKNTLVGQSREVRDLLVEKDPQLSKVFSKEDFMAWVADMLKEGQDVISTPQLSDDFRNETKKQYRIFDKVYTGTALTNPEVDIVLDTIDGFLDAAQTRESDSLSQYVLSVVGAKQFSTPSGLELKEAVQDFAKFRQFKLNVGTGEWIHLA